MAFDFKKEQKELYLPSRAPGILTVPPMNFLAVRGAGGPQPGGGRVPAGHRFAVWGGLYPEDEREGRA